jgi:glycogen debranching enzyme
MRDVDRCRADAIRVLRSCATPIGLKASVRATGYPQIWARDSMITLLGACFLEDEHILQAVRASITTLAQKQSSLGCIPNNVDVATQKPNFQAYADAGLWFVIGNVVLFEQIQDQEFLKQHYDAIIRTLHWYEFQDVDQTGLISIAEASDWQDLLAVRDKGLYVNMLYVIALNKASQAARILGDEERSAQYAGRAIRVQAQLNEHFWYQGKGDSLQHVRFSYGTTQPEDMDVTTLLLPEKTVLLQEQYYLPYLTFRNFGEWFDTCAHLLAILSNTAGEKSHLILQFIEKHELSLPYPVKALYPPIEEGRKDWRDYYRFANLNMPHQYHNGGIWPFLGGFYVAALVKAGKLAQAQRTLERLADANTQGQFNEWLHGKDGTPRGMQEQAWSAGMFLYAYECVKKGKAIFF